MRDCTASAPSSDDTRRIWSANATKSDSPLHPSTTSSSDARSVMSWHSVLANARAVEGVHSPIVPHADISSPKMRAVTASAPAGSEPECRARSYSSSLYSGAERRALRRVQRVQLLQRHRARTLGRQQQQHARPARLVVELDQRAPRLVGRRWGSTASERRDSHGTSSRSQLVGVFSQWQSA